MSRIAFAAAAVAASLAFASAASAASVTIGFTSFGHGGSLNLAGARAAQAAFHGASPKIVEDFEGFVKNGPHSFSAPTIATSVGSFTSIFPAGTGTTDLAPSDQLHVRDGSGVTGSRFNTTLGGKNYLDSNDNSGIKWSLPGGAGLGQFDKLSLLATDIDDVGQATFRILAGGDVVDTTFALATSLSGKRPDGELLLITFAFDSFVKDVTLAMQIDPGDGFAIDDVAVSPVPLPAAAWMLLAGVGALAGVGRARRTA